MKKVHFSRQGATTGRVFHIHPLQLIGCIFLGLGLLFLLLGVIFLLTNRGLLPQLLTENAWVDEMPDELALPMVGLVFSVVGGLFTLIGGIMLIVLRRQRLLREELERYGTRVCGTVTDIVIDQTYQVNGRRPLRILVTAQHPATGSTVTVRSGPIWETTLSTGDAADVLFDPMDERKYLVDLPINH